MKKFTCVLLLIVICLTFVGCSDGDTTIRVVEVEKIVEVPVEVEVEKIVEVPVEVIKEVVTLVPMPVLPPEFVCFSGYDWDSLKAGDFIENVLCLNGYVVIDYETTYSWGSYDKSVSYTYKYNITDTSSVSILNNRGSRIYGVATGTISSIDRTYNEFGHLERIDIRLQ